MRKTLICAVSALLIAGMAAGPVSAYAGDNKDAAIETVTVSTEDLKTLAADGAYLTSLTDGAGNDTIEATLVSADDRLDGGYTAAKSPKLTKSRKKLFKKAFKGFVGSEVKPMAYLASQVVAGTNHLYLCTIKAVVPDAQEYYCFVTIYEDLEGNVSISGIENTEVATDINNLPGGIFAASKVKVSKSIKKAFKKAAKELLGVSYKPVAVLTEQIVAGTNYCILCESQVVYPGASKEYSIVHLYVGLDGSSEITDIVSLAAGESGETE